MADLHRAERHDRMSDNVHTLTRQVPLSMQVFVRKNTVIFTALTKKPECLRTPARRLSIEGLLLSRVRTKPPPIPKATRHFPRYSKFVSEKSSACRSPWPLYRN